MGAKMQNKIIEEQIKQIRNRIELEKQNKGD